MERIVMDKFSEQLHNYLLLAHSSALLVSKGDKANLNILLTMLGPIDKEIIDAVYGLFDTDVVPKEQIAAKYRVKPSVIDEIVAKDLHRLSITPEWQMFIRQLRPAVQKKIGFNKQ